jgi:biopolymer transport protein ExbD
MPNEPPAAGAEGASKPWTPPPPQKPASMAVYKRELRREIRRKAVEPEINFLNITAMLDMMTIILVFLLKSMSASSASIPQSADLQMPQSILTTEAAQEGVAVVVSRSSIMVDNVVVAPVPGNASLGVEGKYKRSGPNDLYIVPVANALQAWRDRDRQVRAATGKDTTGSEAIIIADASTPYRLLTEILFTLGQTEYNKFHLMVLQGRKP